MTFVELMSGATNDQRTKIQISIINDGYSLYTVSSWITGARKPKLFYQFQIQKQVKRIFGIDTTPEELFPER